MRACAILRCRRGIALLVNTLYILYAIVTLAASTYMLLLSADGECDMLALEMLLIYHDFLAVVQFEYLDKVGLCISPVPRMSPVFPILHLISDVTP